ncbi:MAG: vWA domain-containing protein [Planctomycetaceae bacterium]
MIEAQPRDAAWCGSLPPPAHLSFFMVSNASAIVVALVVALLTALAEFWHHRRSQSVARLAFGPSGQPRRWTRIVPFLRVVSMSLAAWGLFVLATLEPQLLGDAGTSNTTKTDPADVQRVVLVLDVSPSMNVVDAGAEQKLRRRDRVLEVVEGIMSRIALSRTRFSVVVFFTSARAVVVDATDINVVRNILDSMPLVWSFEPGETRLLDGVRVAGELARDWPPKSTTMFVCTDGDTVDFSQVPKLPRSVRDLEILAVGDPVVGTLVGNHASRQEAGILRRLAAELHGSYHNVNTQHLPSKALAELARVPPPPPSLGWQIKDLARIAVTIAAVLLTLIPVALQYFGSAWNAERELPTVVVASLRDTISESLRDSPTKGSPV